MCGFSVTPQIFHNIFSIYLNICSWYNSLIIILSDFIYTCMLLISVTLCELIKTVSIFYFNYFLLSSYLINYFINNYLGVLVIF